MPGRGENWKLREHQIRQDFRQSFTPNTYGVGGTMPDLGGGGNPMHPNTAEGLRAKLDYRAQLKNRQAWMAAGNEPTPPVTDLPVQPTPQYGQQYNPTVGLPQPQVRRRGRGPYPDITY